MSVNTNEASMKQYIYNKLLSKLMDELIERPTLDLTVPKLVIPQIYKRLSGRNKSRVYYELLMTRDIHKSGQFIFWNICEIDTKWFEDDNDTSVPWSDKTYTKKMYKERIPIVCFELSEYRDYKLMELMNSN